MAQYRAICDVWLPNNTYAQAGDLLSDAVPTPAGYVPIPSGWMPCLGVDPVDSDGLQKFFNAGPTGAMGSAEHGALSTVFSGNRWQGIAVAPAVHYWRPTVQGGVKVWVVNGAESLGWKDNI